MNTQICVRLNCKFWKRVKNVQIKQTGMWRASWGGGGGTFQFFRCIETKRVNKKYTKRESNIIAMNNRWVNEPSWQKQELAYRHSRLLFTQEPCLDRRVTYSFHNAEKLIRKSCNSSWKYPRTHSYYDVIHLWLRAQNVRYSASSCINGQPWTASLKSVKISGILTD